MIEKNPIQISEHNCALRITCSHHIVDCYCRVPLKRQVCVQECTCVVVEPLLSLHCSGQQPVMCACARICYHAQASARFSKLFTETNYSLRNEISPRRLCKQLFLTIYLESEFIFNYQFWTGS